VYLNDGCEFDGGDTLFYADGPAAATNPVIARVRPRVGSLIVFDHGLWHAGECVRSGVKHILRSDVLYRRAAPALPANYPAAPAGHQGYVWALAGLDANTLASGGRDTRIRIWDGHGRSLRALHGHSQSVLGLAALPQGRLASVSRDRSLRIWNWRTGTCECIVENAHAGAILCVAALPGGGMATGGADGQINLWSADGTRTASLDSQGGWVWEIAVLPDGCLLSASEDGHIRLWNSACAQPLRSLTLAPDGSQIVSGDIAGGMVVWARHAGRWEYVKHLHAHRAAIRRVRFIGNDRIASAGEDHKMHIWSLPDCALLQTQQHGNFVTDVLAMGDAVLSCSYDGRIQFMDTDLQTQWAQTWHALGLADATGDRSLTLFQELLARYREPHRKYHTLQHLRECLALCARDGALAHAPAEVAMALWFHDAVYTHGRHDNELASANWARQALLEAGASDAAAQRIHDLVMATCHQATPGTADAQLLVDIDLAILGAAPERFQSYEQQIRDEYSHVAAPVFRAKRREVLQSFLQRNEIYATPTYRNRLEAAARANLQAAIAQ
jgi:predicted metal-dependent HD superfamily phosphohydrolase